MRCLNNDIAVDIIVAIPPGIKVINGDPKYIPINIACNNPKGNVNKKKFVTSNLTIEISWKSSSSLCK